MPGLRNMKQYHGDVARNGGIATTDQIQLVTRTSVPTDSNVANGRIVYVTSTGLRVYIEGAWATIPTTTSGGTATAWDTLYASDKTLTIGAGTLTFDGTHGTNDVFTLKGAGTGTVLQITQSSTGDDIQGTSDTWAVTPAGIAEFAHVFLADNAELRFGNVVGTADASITWDTALLNIAGAVDFDDAVTMQSGFTLAAGDSVITDGSLTITDGDNAPALSVTNNTITTDNSGIVTFISTSLTEGSLVKITANALTTGSLLWLETSDSTMNGEYIYCYDGGAVDFSVGEDGRVIITGASGIAALTISNGDTVISDGSITLTDADNATSLSVTNNSATSNDMVAFTSSGTTTGSLLILTSTGTIATTGRILEMVADSATDSSGVVSLTIDALTTGVGVLITSMSSALAAGQLMNLDHTVTASSLTPKTGQLIDIVASRIETRTSASTSDDYDVLSVIRTNRMNGGGGTLNAAGSMLYLQNTATQSAGTLEDTVNGIEIDLQGGVEAQGYAIDITHTGTTVGRAINIAASQTSGTVMVMTADSLDSGIGFSGSFDALTTGEGMFLEHTTSVITTGSVLRVTSTGIDTGTGQGTLLDLNSTAATAATVVSLTADAITGGVGFFATFDGLTTGEGFSLTHTTSVIADGGSLFRLSSTGVDTGGATNGTVFDLAATGQIAGTVALMTASAITGGTGLSILAGALTTGTTLNLTGGGTYTGSAGVLAVTADTATTGDVVVVSATGKTTGGAILNLIGAGGTMTTGDYLTCYDGSLDAFAIRRNGHLSSRQSTPPSIAVGIQNGLTNAFITAGSTDVVGIITTTGTSAAGDTVFTVTFEEAYAVAPVVQLTPANEAAAQNADDAGSGAYVSATTTSTFVVTIPGASGSTPSWFYSVMEMGS